MDSVAKDDLVERRLKYIQRQIRLDTGAVNVRFAGRRPEGSGPPNRHDMPALPVGQHEVKNWPVLDLGDHPEIPLDTWTLEVGGLVENPFTLTWDQFLALPQTDDVSDFHCVTTWSRLRQPLARRAIQDHCRAGGAPRRRRVRAVHGLRHRARLRHPLHRNLPLARAVDDDVLLVHTWEGKPLPREHGGPCRMITPKLYAWKGAKWIRKIEFLAEDRKGFWEVRGYSNSAEPWFNDRYSTDEEP